MLPVDLLADMTENGVTLQEAYDCAADMVDDYAQDAFEEAGSAASRAQQYVEKADELRLTGEAVEAFERAFV